jgi:hypothetical protein
LAIASGMGELAKPDRLKPVLLTLDSRARVLHNTPRLHLN